MAATPWQWIALGVSLALVVAAAFTVPIRVGIGYGRAGDGGTPGPWLLVGAGSLKARIRLGRPERRGGARLFTSRVRRGSQRDPSRKALVLSRALRAFRLLRPALRVIERLEWRTELGTGDAAVTSFLTGALWAVKSTVVGTLAKEHVFLEPPKIRVVPDFRHTRFSWEISCIFRFTLGEIILGARTSRATARRG